MVPEGSLATKNSGAMGAKSGGSSRHVMKKGPWTAAEDAILMEYVKKHGEGNWNAVQRNSGLMRCGKSCRLRWANHLRPNLKKGPFSPEEENLIFQLHAKLGNKWARMASQLPGRTDNEIKNYWNTRLKRRQRAGLPTYPLDIKPQNHHQHQEHAQTSPSSSTLLSLLSSSHSQKPEYTPPLSIFDIFSSSPAMVTPLQSPINSSCISKSLALSLSSANPLFSPPSASSLAYNNQGFSQSIPMPSLHFDNLNYGIDSRPVSRPFFENDGTCLGSSEMGLPSIQSLVQANTTTTSSGSDYVIPTSSSEADDLREHDHDHDETVDGFSRNARNSGLLEDLLGESQALTRATKAKEISLNEEDKSQGKFLWDYKLMEDTTAGVNRREEYSEDLSFSHGNVILDQSRGGDSSPAHSSITRAKRMKASSDESINPVDEDLLSLLDNFPSAVTMPEWNDENGNLVLSNWQSLNSTGGDAGKENQTESSYSPAATTPETTDHNNWTIGACSWKNLPGIY